MEGVPARGWLGWGRPYSAYSLVGHDRRETDPGAGPYEC